MSEDTGIEELTRKVNDLEKEVDTLRERFMGAAMLLNQMDMFIREMMRVGHFDASVAKLQSPEPEKKIIM